MLYLRRVAVRKDSCSIVAISLNIQEKVHPIIWSLEGLPFDCEQVIPIPKPVGMFSKLLYYILRQNVCQRVINLNFIIFLLKLYPQGLNVFQSMMYDCPF